jgi:phage replication initiation protein
MTIFDTLTAAKRSTAAAFQFTPYTGQGNTDHNPPSSNTGGNVSTEEQEERSEQSGERLCIIDYLTIVFPLNHFTPKGFYLDDELHEQLSEYFANCGVLISSTVKGGKYGYTHHFEVTDLDGNPCGFLAYGGNNDTFCLSITGSGTQTLTHQNYVNFKNAIISLDGHITRVDLAHDCFHGEISLDDVMNWYDAGLMTSGSGRYPSAKHINDYGSGEGSSFYVGSRKSGKMLRAYEKGKQLGDKSSLWTRIELELRRIDRDIPPEILISASEFMSAAYKALQFLDQQQSYIETHKNTVAVSYQHLEKYCREAYGKLIAFMGTVYETPEEIINVLSREGQGLPRRLQLLNILPEH